MSSKPNMNDNLNRAEVKEMEEKVPSERPFSNHSLSPHQQHKEPKRSHKIKKNNKNIVKHKSKRNKIKKSNKQKEVVEIVEIKENDNESKVPKVKNDSRRFRFKVDINLDEHQKSVLEEFYPGVKFCPSDRAHANHPILHTERHYLNHWITCFRLSKSKIVDVGGSASRNKLFNITDRTHTMQPLLTMNDFQRHSNIKGCRNVCHHKMQDCGCHMQKYKPENKYKKWWQAVDYVIITSLVYILLEHFGFMVPLLISLFLGVSLSMMFEEIADSIPHYRFVKRVPVFIHSHYYIPPDDIIEYCKKVRVNKFYVLSHRFDKIQESLFGEARYRVKFGVDGRPTTVRMNCSGDNVYEHAYPAWLLSQLYCSKKIKNHYIKSVVVKRGLTSDVWMCTLVETDIKINASPSPLPITKNIVVISDYVVDGDEEEVYYRDGTKRLPIDMKLYQSLAAQTLFDKRGNKLMKRLQTLSGYYFSRSENRAQKAQLIEDNMYADTILGTIVYTFTRVDDTICSMLTMNSDQNTDVFNDVLENNISFDEDDEELRGVDWVWYLTVAAYVCILGICAHYFDPLSLLPGVLAADDGGADDPTKKKMHQSIMALCTAALATTVIGCKKRKRGLPKIGDVKLPLPKHRKISRSHPYQFQAITNPIPMNPLMKRPDATFSGVETMPLEVTTYTCILLPIVMGHAVINHQRVARTLIDVRNSLTNRHFKAYNPKRDAPFINDPERKVSHYADQMIMRVGRIFCQRLVEESLSFDDCAVSLDYWLKSIKPARRKDVELALEMDVDYNKALGTYKAFWKSEIVSIVKYVDDVGYVHNPRLRPRLIFVPHDIVLAKCGPYTKGFNTALTNKFGVRPLTMVFETLRRQKRISVQILFGYGTSAVKLGRALGLISKNCPYVVDEDGSGWDGCLQQHTQDLKIKMYEFLKAPKHMITRLKRTRDKLKIYLQNSLVEIETGATGTSGRDDTTLWNSLLNVTLSVTALMQCDCPEKAKYGIVVSGDDSMLFSSHELTHDFLKPYKAFKEAYGFYPKFGDPTTVDAPFTYEFCSKHFIHIETKEEENLLAPVPMLGRLILRAFSTHRIFRKHHARLMYFRCKFESYLDSCKMYSRLHRAIKTICGLLPDIDKEHHAAKEFYLDHRIEHRLSYNDYPGSSVDIEKAICVLKGVPVECYEFFLNQCVEQMRAVVRAGDNNHPGMHVIHVKATRIAPLLI